jgi:phenylacetaldehyde dehydrogenase
MNEMSRIAAQPEYSEAARQTLAREPRLFIDGEWVRSTGEKRITVYDPSTGREIASTVDATDEDVDRAVAAARRAFDDGRWTRLSPRSANG